jgi:hypothetical protein
MPDQIVPDDAASEVELRTGTGLTVFRSRRTRDCDGCGEPIRSGDDYFRVGLDSFHRGCLPEDSRQ